MLYKKKSPILIQMCLLAHFLPKIKPPESDCTPLITEAVDIVIVEAMCLCIYMCMSSHLYLPAVQT